MRDLRTTKGCEKNTSYASYTLAHFIAHLFKRAYVGRVYPCRLGQMGQGTS